MPRSIMIVAASLCLTALASVLIVIINFFPGADKLSRRVACLWARLLLFVSGVRVDVLGGENVLAAQP
ncbi:MAG: hypothetical protein L7F78_23120, partial [Syntrophales bacterium LBB04]|nr:hypothetical protein [Syntrophales bacterium LBB04]